MTILDLRNREKASKKLCLLHVRSLIKEPFSFCIQYVVNFYAYDNYWTVFADSVLIKNGEVVLHGFDKDGEEWEIKDEWLTSVELLEFIEAIEQLTELPEELKGVPQFADDVGSLFSTLSKGKPYFIRIETTDGLKTVGPIASGEMLGLGLVKLNGCKVKYRIEGSDEWKELDVRLGH
jgi:hypothetical protein